jgi:hypothetical protein
MEYPTMKFDQVEKTGQVTEWTQICNFVLEKDKKIPLTKMMSLKKQSEFIEDQM